MNEQYIVLGIIIFFALLIIIGLTVFIIKDKGIISNTKQLIKMENKILEDNKEDLKQIYKNTAEIKKEAYKDIAQEITKGIKEEIDNK